MFGSATVKSFSVIDPCNRTGKIEIPASFVTETKGVTDWLRYGQNPPPDAKDLSLCLLYQRGRCNAGTRCNQVHAAAEFVETLRQRALAVKSCCSKHGDVHSVGLDASLTVAVAGDGQSNSYSLLDFATTEALELAVKRVRDGVVRVSANRVCRLHQKGSCKFGKDCKNIHLCHQAVPLSEAALRTPVKPRTADVSPAPQTPVVGKAAALVVIPTTPVVTPIATPLIPATPPPALGFAFRSLDITNRACDVSSASVSSAASERSCSKAPVCEDSGHFLASARPTCLSLLSGIGEFNSIRHDDQDPLDILENGSTFSDAVIDFDAFVDGLVECEPETLASPAWVVA